MEEGFRRGPFRIAPVGHLEGCVEADFLVDALERLQWRHPKLRARVVQGADGRRRYHFDQPPAPIPLEVRDYDAEELPWRQEAARLQQIPVDGPAAVVTVLRSRSQGRSLLILSAHHGLADGRACLTLVADVLSEYAKAEAHLDGPALPSLPLITALRAKPSGGWTGRWRLMRRFLRLERTERRSPPTPLPDGRGIPAFSQWVHWVLSREETLRLIRRCRQERVSSSAALVSAVYCALMDCLPLSEALFKLHCPFDVRDTLERAEGPVTAEDVGCFVSSMRTLCRVRQQPAFWALAKEIHDDLQDFTRSGGPALGYNLTSMALSRAVPRPVDSSRRPTLLFTNYGVINLAASYGSLRVRECTLALMGDQFTGHRLIMEALVMGQRLNLGFAADGLEPSFWERLQAAVRRQVDTLCA
jgi:hypothetical protein